MIRPAERRVVQVESPGTMDAPRGCPTCGQARIITTDGFTGIARESCPGCERLAERAKHEATQLRFALERVARHFGLALGELERRCRRRGEGHCWQCGTALAAGRGWLYCSSACKSAAWRRRRGSRTRSEGRRAARYPSRPCSRCGGTFRPTGPAARYCANCGGRAA